MSDAEPRPGKVKGDGFEREEQPSARSLGGERGGCRRRAHSLGALPKSARAYSRGSATMAVTTARGGSCGICCRMRSARLAWHRGAARQACSPGGRLTSLNDLSTSRMPPCLREWRSERRRRQTHCSRTPRSDGRAAGNPSAPPSLA
eukprot:702842-Pleurochrysis_carterae.AAC.1